jgi:hypothetical protein
MTDDARRWFAERAVPVGGWRRGGFVCVDGEEGAAVAIALLAGIPGFPNVRAVLSHDPEVADNVRWGDDEPSVPQSDDASDLEWACSEMAAGRFYGYSEKAIRDFLVKQWGSP